LYVNHDVRWDTLERAHFDLNTCLREAIILLKSFLVVLPDDQLSSFESALELPKQHPDPVRVTFRHRRFAALPGK